MQATNTEAAKNIACWNIVASHSVALVCFVQQVYTLRDKIHTFLCCIACYLFIVWLKFLTILFL